QGFRAFARFMDKQGFYVVLGVCVCVIVATAMWARVPSAAPVRPGTLSPGIAADGVPEFVQQLADVQQTAAPQAPAARLLSDLPLSWPVEGDVLRAFSAEKPVYWPTLDSWGTHLGLDIAASAGSMVRAVRDGEVIGCAEDKLWGGVIEIRHPGGLRSRYCGVGMPFLVQAGDPVTQGQAIAVVACSAMLEQSEPAHLHLEMMQEDVAVDPEKLLP
ncbi:MAG: M23 family metallopeptidase, partial [Clostridia bacterium]